MCRAMAAAKRKNTKRRSTASGRRSRRGKGRAGNRQQPPSWRARWLLVMRRYWRWLLLAISPVLLLSLLILLLRWVPVPTTAFMLVDPAEQIDYLWVPMERISPRAALAVVAAEDQKFPLHWGFDFRSILNAARTNRHRERPRGASTITQQTAKNLFLWSGGGLLRKGLEAWIALNIELLWPKRRILEVYLNIAEMGPGVYGVEAASRRYFGVPASRLQPWQAARLAAVLPSPKRYSVRDPSEQVLRQADWIEGQMRNLGPEYIRDL